MHLLLDLASNGREIFTENDSHQNNTNKWSIISLYSLPSQLTLLLLLFVSQTEMKMETNVSKDKANKRKERKKEFNPV